jgi:hypothetical protein
MPLVDLRIGGQRIARMQIERDVEPLDDLPEGPVLRQVVVGDRPLADLREAIDQGAPESELVDATL